MNRIKQHISLLLVIAISYAYLGRTVHELFFHHEGVHCDAKTEKHFHHVEHEQEDLIYTFSFSTSSEVNNKNHHLFSLLNEKTIISEYLTVFINNHCNKNTPLRGPPCA